MPDRFLISGYTGIGNFVMKTPMLRKLRDLYPEAAIDLITENEEEASFLLASGSIDRILRLPRSASMRERYSFFRALRKSSYRAAFISFDASGRTMIHGTRIARIPHRYVHVRFDRSKERSAILKRSLWDPSFHPVPVLPGRHETDLNLDLLEAYHAKPMSRERGTFLVPPDETGVLERHGLVEAPYIVFQPGAANGKINAKSVSTEQSLAILNGLLSSFPYKILLVGDEGDRKLFLEPLLAKLGKNERVLDTAGRTGLSELIELLHHASLVICHDSGVMHLADAMERRTIALYGPTDYMRTRPLKKSSHLLFSENAYTGCMYNERISEEEVARLNEDGRVMKDLDPQKVIALAEELLKEEELEGRRK